MFKTRNYRVFEVPREFHLQHPPQARPKLRLFRDGWMVAYWLLLIPSLVMSGFLLIGNNPSKVSSTLGLVLLIGAAHLAGVLVCIRLLPIYKGTPRRLVALAVLWGGAASVVLAAVVIQPPVVHAVDKLGWHRMTASFAGAYPEEIAKGLGIWLLLWMGRAWWNRPWHGIIAGLLVGLGFEVFENMMYAMMLAVMDPVSDVRGAMSTYLLRMVAGPAKHMMFSALVGYGIGLALFVGAKAGKQRTVAWRLGAVVLWGGLGFLTHFAWNVRWIGGASAFQLLWLACVWVGLAAVVIWLIVRTSREFLRWKRQGVCPAVAIYQRV